MAGDEAGAVSVAVWESGEASAEGLQGLFWWGKGVMYVEGGRLCAYCFIIVQNSGTGRNPYCVGLENIHGVFVSRVQALSPYVVRP